MDDPRDPDRPEAPGEAPSAGGSPATTGELTDDDLGDLAGGVVSIVDPPDDWPRMPGT